MIFQNGLAISDDGSIKQDDNGVSRSNIVKRKEDKGGWMEEPRSQISEMRGYFSTQKNKIQRCNFKIIFN